MSCSNERIEFAIIFSLITLFCCTFQFAQSDNLLIEKENNRNEGNDTIFVSYEYDQSFAKPILITKGDIVICDCNEIRLVNSQRYEFYEKLRYLLSDSINISRDSIINKYEKLLSNYKKDYNFLKKNCDSSSKYFSSLLSESDSVLTLTERSLDISQRSLKELKLSLIEAESLLNQKRTYDLYEKIYIGLGSFGLGVVIALLAN